MILPNAAPDKSTLSHQANLPPNYFWLFPSQGVMHAKNRIRFAIDSKLSWF
ncbi:hypothetical protein HMPREF0542_11830 [Ligilactobacillus ruminis ATCC 25644]|uniref:Uncharacterized protein n=1 Tax=Ligilactobacillus ruminis ATCC 25644 TaxID=525362 RepID=E7FSF3_9LACO|nr:hypothetical protein HMPREF0542_11830 [Ligilactobacillus ruminis ATCC 25644]